MNYLWSELKFILKFAWGFEEMHETPAVRIVGLRIEV
jgi:hypothetical protein